MAQLTILHENTILFYS